MNDPVPTHFCVCVVDLITKQVCITAGDYEASMTAMEMMAQMGLQPEPEQEKRMLQSCIDPLWIAKQERARAREEGVEEDGEETDFWREKDQADLLADEEEMG